MILQFGIHSQISNLVTLIGTEGLPSARSLRSLSELQAGYRRFIERVQHRRTAGRPGVTEIVTNTAQASRFRPLFANDSLLDDKAQSIVIKQSKDTEVEEKRLLLERALKELSLYSREHRTLFDTIITDIFILPSDIAKAGSTSAALGVIWANPRVQYTLHDVMEILVHELTHHTMFIDEFRYSHYAYEAITDRSTWATSAILHALRPLDKVLHSAVVAAEVLLLREKFLGHPLRPAVHPPTPLLRHQLSESVASMEAIRQKTSTTPVLLERACEILENLKRVDQVLLRRH